jgi:Tfp pilus assembly protein PilF
MLALMAYARYAARPGAGRYSLVVACLALGLLAKPMLVTLPIVLLLLDVWPLRRWCAGLETKGAGVPLPRLIAEKVPLCVLAVASSAIALVAQRSVGAVGSLEVLPLGVRLQNAVSSYVFYVWKSVWPTGLAFYYPHPSLSGGSGGAPAAALVTGFSLATITFAVAAALRRRPYLAVGWFWFLGTLVPVIGLVQVGMQAHADRYSYIPTVGLYVLLAWAMVEWVEHSPRVRSVLSAAGGLAVGACLVATWIQVGHWRDSRALAEHALRVTKNNYQAHNMLGVVQQREDDPRAAHDSYRRALEIKPDFTQGQINLGTLLGDVGRLDDAADLFRLALRTNPGQAGLRAHNGLGAVLEKQGDLAGAMEHLEQALEIDPNFAEAHNNLGVVHARLGRLDAARAEYEKALEVSPDYGVAHRNRERSERASSWERPTPGRGDCARRSSSSSACWNSTPTWPRHTTTWGQCTPSWEIQKGRSPIWSGPSCSLPTTSWRDGCSRPSAELQYPLAKCARFFEEPPQTMHGPVSSGWSKARQRMVAFVSSWTRSSHASSPHQCASRNPPGSASFSVNVS